ncbi:MAG: hypothetical protein R3C05_01525 [Pirellulaceae bacterium]
MLSCVNISQLTLRRGRSMALEPEDREDLLGEATGLPMRGELQIESCPPIVVGFRSDDAASWYFGADPVFQFDPTHRLRRVFNEGIRYAVAAGGIVRLSRPAVGGRVRFEKELLDDAETDQLLQLWETKIAPVHAAIQSRSYRWTGASVEVDAIETKVIQWLERLPTPIPIARTSRLRKPKRK